MACEERPYERCEQFGASNLTDSELLAVCYVQVPEERMRFNWRIRSYILYFAEGCAESSSVDVRTADADQRNREGKGYPDFVSGGA